jgi:hypothetical protein
MSHSSLPHDDYIGAVINALTEAGLEPPEFWTSDSETKGVFCYLNAIITLDPNGLRDLDFDEIPAGASWPHGLILSWEWHTGLEEGGDPEKGPVWEFAELKSDGSNEYPTGLPVHGYASPAAIVDAARKVITREIGAGHFHNFGLAKWDGGTIGGAWEHSDQVDASCEIWGKDEGSE